METPEARGYAICTEPRSGSVFLCQLLASTGVLGAPTEFFDPLFVQRAVPDYPADPEAQLLEIPRLGSTPNGVYGLKVFARHFDAVRHTRWVERLPRLSFVHLIRLDVLGQAVSHVRAMQTQQWTARAKARCEPVYDFELINAELLRLINSQARWAYYFGRNGIPFLHLAYEHLVQQPQRAVEAVAQLIGLQESPVVDFSKVSAAIQRDELSEEWRRRYVAQARDLAHFH
ncbi:MAG TPA: Stf0 family sulfotransferase [Caulobacteraceae bacterium]|nr:Stf0 family sulfotransferase [Caulobacteraceae bacterium]